MQQKRLWTMIFSALLTLALCIFTSACEDRTAQDILFGTGFDTEGEWNIWTGYGTSGCQGSSSSNDKPQQISEYRLTLYDETEKPLGDYRFTNSKNNSLNAEHCNWQKDGYYFAGWKTKEGRQVFNYTGNQISAFQAEETKLYPIWYVYEYYYTCKAQEGTFTNNATEIEYVYVYSETVPVNFPVPVHNDETLTFVGWYNEDYSKQYTNGEGKLLEASLEQAGLRSPSLGIRIPVYAKYQKKIYTITIDYGEGFPSASIELACDVPLTALDTDEYKKDVGNAMVTGFTLIDGAPLPEYATENLTVKATWKPYVMLTLHYDDRLPTVRLKLDPNTPLASINLAEYQKEEKGQEVLSWEVDGGGELPETLTKPLTLRAVWANFRDVQFVYFEGDIRTQRVYEVKGEGCTLPVPNEAGYRLVGWYENDAYSGRVITTTSLISLKNTYYAKWEIAEYTVTFVSTNGENFPPITYRYGEEKTLPIPQIRDGYIFKGWSETPNAQTGIYKITKEMYGDKTLYASWKAGQSYLVRYETGANATAIPAQSYEKGSRLVFPEPPVSTDGKYFDGWYSQDKQTEYTEKSFVSGEMTLYAKWIESKPVSTADDLRAIANDPAGNYHLTNDINLRGENWTPIPEFTGTLNGNGYKIYAFMLLCNPAQETAYGFIANNKGTLKNLTFSEVDAVLTQKAHNVFMGIIAGKNAGKITNCSVRKDCELKFTLILPSGGSAFAQIGGLVGQSTGVLEACTSETQIYDGAIEESGYLRLEVGGLVGTIEAGGKATDCAYLGKITVPNIAVYGWNRTFDFAVGGIAGKIIGKAERCSAHAEIRLTYSNETTYTHYLGGFVGYSSGNISACASSGKLQGSLLNPTSGGFVGYNYGEIKDCYTTVDTEIEIKKVDTYEIRVGGFVGNNDKTVTNCYALGNVTCGGPEISGFAGKNTATGVISRSFFAGNVTNTHGKSPFAFLCYFKNSGTVIRCYVEETTVLTSGTATVTQTETTGVTAETRDALQSREFFTETLYWDESVWSFTENEYPKLFWETAQ